MTWETCYGVPESELRTLIYSETGQTGKSDSVDGFYLSKAKLEEMIAQTVGIKERARYVDSAIQRETVSLLDKMYDIKRDTGNFRNK